MGSTDEIKYTRISWTRCINRCHNPKDPDYHRYGAKGIVVCERWRNSFLAFFTDMGVRPKGLTLDRIESSGNYEPSNCRWATSAVQNRHAVHEITYKGKTQSLGAWAEDLGMKQTTLTMRLKRMSVEDAFETPVQK